MPNYCDYSMCVKGTKEGVEEFINVIKADYDYNTKTFSYDRHLFRVFAADYDEVEEMLDGTYQIIINGYCAWSVASCMLENGYYARIKDAYPNDFRGTTLMLESERLNLNIEVFSEECGCCFQEHYVIKQGILEVDECVDYYEFCKEDYKSKVEAEKALKTEITDEEWNNDDTYIVRGGFEWDFEI